MNKEIQARYPTSADLADDLARWLRGDATLARPISPAERATRWCRRNPAVAGLIAAVILLTIIGVGGISAALVDSQFARGRAEVAQTNAETARDASVKSEAKEKDAATKAKDAAARAEASLQEANKQKKRADESLKLAQDREKEAEKQRSIAQTNEKNAKEALERFEEQRGKTKEAEEGKSAADKKAKEAGDARDTAQRKLRFDDYADHLKLADKAIDLRDLETAKLHLAKCEEDMRGWEWHYLNAVAKGRETLAWQADLPLHPMMLAFSPDGEWLMAGADSGRGGKSWNQLWVSFSGTAIPFPGGNAQSRGGGLMSFSDDPRPPYSNLIVTVNNSNGGRWTARVPQAAVHIWQLKDGQVRHLADLPPLKGTVVCCRHDEGGDWLAHCTGMDIRPPTSSDIVSARLRFVPTNSSNRFMVYGEPTTAPLEGSLQCAAFLSKGRGVAVTHSYSPEKLRLYEIPIKPGSSALEIGTRHSYTKKLDSRPSDIGICLLPDGRKGAVLAGGSLQVFGEGLNPDEVVELPAFGQPSFDPTGRRIALASLKNGIQFVNPDDPSSGRILYTLETPPVVEPKAPTGLIMAFSHDGQRLAVAKHNQLFMFDLGEPVPRAAP